MSGFDSSRFQAALLLDAARIDRIHRSFVAPIVADVLRRVARAAELACDSDGSGEAGQTAEQAGPKATARAEGIAHPLPQSPSPETGSL